MICFSYASPTKGSHCLSAAMAIKAMNQLADLS